MAKRWYNDGLKWNFSGAEYPIDDYSASFNSTDILSMNALIANHMDSSKKYIYKFITESGNVIDSQETPIINPYGVYTVHLEKPFYEMGLNNGKRGVYIELYDLNSTLLDKIGPITFTVKNVPPNCSITTDADLGGWEWSRDKIRIWIDASDIDGNVTQVEVESSTDHSSWHNIGTDHSPPWMIWWDTTSISQDDSVWIRARAKDDSGDYSDWCESGPYKIDNNLPFTSYSLSPSSPDGENGWYKSDVTVTLTANDSGSGVYKTWYKLDWGTGHSDWMEYDGPQTIGEIGKSVTFYYYSEDNACDYHGAWGNKEVEKNCSFKIDKTKPSASISINDGEEYTDSRSVTLYLSHSDDTSGVDKCRYKNEGEPWTEWESCSPTKSWTLTKGDGTKTVYYQVKDKAGNIKEVFDTIVLDTTPTDTTPPTIISVSPSGGATGVPVTTKISATFSEAMNTASVEAAFSITPSIAGTFIWVGNTMTFTPITNLAHSTTYTVTISATATDMAGNGLDGNKNGIAEGSPADDYIWSFTTLPLSEATISFNPPKSIVSVGSVAEINLTLDKAQDGLSGYNISISLSNTSVAEVTSVNFPAWATLHSNSTLPADSFWIKAADINDKVKSGATDVNLGTLMLRGDNKGTSNILITVTKMDDDNGYPINPNTIPGVVEVPPPCSPFPSCTNPPTDPDGDGLCEDINGNGRLDFNDVVVFFNNLEWAERQPIECWCYDFNGNGRIDFDDVKKLFDKI